MKPRDRRRAQTEAAIIDASLKLLTEQGIEGLTIAKIARAIDYTPGALYRYYPSKDAIIAELHRRFIEDFEAQLRAHLLNLPPDAPPITPLLTAASSYSDFVQSHPTRFRLLAVGLADPRVLVSEEAALSALPAYLSLYSVLAQLFATALAAGALHTNVPVQDLTLSFVLALQTPLQAQKLRAHAPPTFQTSHLYRIVVDALLIGWGGDPATIAAARRSISQEEASDSSG